MGRAGRSTRLDAIAEEVADLAIDELRAALATKGAGRPASEKRLSQVRRSIDKAAHLLRRPLAGSEADED